MIERYTRPEMAEVWSLENKYRTWLMVELFACEAWAKKGVIPKRELQVIKKKAAFSVDRVEEIEKETKHDVIAFLTNVAENVGPESRFIHWGLTSSDILDTSMAVLLKQAADLIIDDLIRLTDIIKRRAFEYKNTIMIGRSHGVHAEPITFGLKFAIWYDEMRRNLDRLKAARETIAYGKLSGAVGTFANIDPDVEAYVCKKCGLKPAPASSQIVQRDRYAYFFSVLAVLAGSIEKIALEVRHLQRTEVLEAEEYFSAGQKGSSAMPHKRNPINSENLCGLARLVRSYSQAALENVPLWHERDISHSSVERVIAPDATILVHFMLHRTINLLDRLIVYPERMKENLERTGGLIFSQQILLLLTQKGTSREEAYKIVQRNAMQTWEKGGDFKALLLKDKELKKHLSRKEIEDAFDINHHLRHVDSIFGRVFGQ